MMTKIKSIKILATRGIPDLTLELGGKSLLLHGETGTGKSSLVDAIEFFFTGKMSPLEGVRGLSILQHGPHVNFKLEDVSVEVVFNPGNVSLTRSFELAPSVPPSFEDYFLVAQKGTFILRRSQILEFIISRPAERFRAIGSIIGTEPLDEVEREMMRLRDNLGGEVDTREKKIRDLVKDLTDVIGTKVATPEDVILALNEILQEANLPLMKSLEEDDVKSHAREIIKKVKKAALANKINALLDISNVTKVALITEDFVTKVRSLNDDVKDLLGKQARMELLVAEILESGKKIIVEQGMDVCPLCGQEIKRKDVLTKIGRRLETLRDLSEKASNVRKASVPLKTKLNDTVEKLRQIALKTEPFLELAGDRKKIEENLQFLSDFADTMDPAVKLEHEIPVQELEKNKDNINKAWGAISSKCDQLVDTEVSEEEKEMLQIVGLIAQARGKIGEISKAHIELEYYQKYYDIANKIYNVFSDTKKSKIQEIYDEIRSDIQAFYSILNPGEPCTNIVLTVDFGRRASTKLEIDAFGRIGEDPRAFVSEGHLDSLGLCIFLAFVRKFNEGCSLVVLDDVVTTIDAKHRERICRLLTEKFEDKQLIITTHDELWFEQLSSFLGGNCKKMSIVGWDVNTGPLFIDYKPRWGAVQEKLANGDKSAGADGRIYLEWLLKRICENTNAPVPVKYWEEGTVGALLSHAKKRIETLAKDDSFKDKVTVAFTEIERTKILANILSHDNPLAGEVSIEEVRYFCNCVHQLHEIFLCPNCSHFIGYYPDLAILRCSNQKCRNPIEVKTQ